MKIRILILFCLSPFLAVAQAAPHEQQKKAVQALIDSYSQAREKSDTVLLKTILTDDVDQLVSTGEWRSGIAAAVKGMVSSSTNNPGKRTLTIDKIRFNTATSGVVDCRYEIQNPDGSLRKMWSTFFIVQEKRAWKICAIRNMMPSSN